MDELNLSAEKAMPSGFCPARDHVGGKCSAPEWSDGPGGSRAWTCARMHMIRPMLL